MEKRKEYSECLSTLVGMWNKEGFKEKYFFTIAEYKDIEDTYQLDIFTPERKFPAETQFHISKKENYCYIKFLTRTYKILSIEELDKKPTMKLEDEFDGEIVMFYRENN